MNEPGSTNAGHPIRCRCGAFSGLVRLPAPATRAVCYCRDCQAFARFLGTPPGMLDSMAGTDVVVVPSRFVTFTAGRSNLVCMSLSPRGTLRWYTQCCKTPIANTPRNPRLSHVGLVHSGLQTGGPSLDAAFGPVRMRVNTDSALGKPAPNAPLAFASAVVGYLFAMAWTRLSGGHRINPFFEPGSERPFAEPTVVSLAERRALRGDVAGDGG